MSPEQAVERIHALLSHAWMVRTFLKHSEEIQEDAEMLEVHRMIFDYCRALEPSYQRRDVSSYLRRAQGKLSKLRKQADFFAANFRRITDHTNFQMAAQSLQTVVADLEKIVADLKAARADAANAGSTEDEDGE